MSAAPTKQSFKVLAGIHYERNPNWDPKGSKPHDPNRDVKYSQGDIVESDRPLDELFAGKFEKAIPGVNAPVVVTEARRVQVSQLIDGGEWPNDDRKFLEELSEADFHRIIRRSQKTIATEDRKKVTSPLGEDVTDLFQRAYDEGFKVFRNAVGKHQITKSGSAKPINKEPLDADKVDKFVGDFLKEK